MSLENLYIDYNIEIASDDDKHFRDGWVNVACPYCTGNPGYHLGFNIDGRYFHCHRCGGHFIDETIAKLLNINRQAAQLIIKDYRISSKQNRAKIVDTSTHQKVNIHSFKYPTHTGPMNDQQKRYLKHRGFDPNFLERKFGLLGTSPFSKLDNIPYKFRILAPIYWEGHEVSFQTRDWTGKQEMRYLACPKRRELINHQSIIYGRNKSWQNEAICVEGITDVWRFVKNTFAIFGIAYTPEQVRLISKLFDRIFIAFDPEKQAQEQAIKLKKELNFRGVEVENIILDSDPGEMSQKEANYLLKQLKL